MYRISVFFGLFVTLLITGSVLMNMVHIGSMEDRILSPLSITEMDNVQEASYVDSSLKKGDTNESQIDSNDKSTNKSITADELNTSVFATYWSDLTTLGRNPHDRYIYFGVAVNTDGVIEDDPGYRSLNTFVKSVPNGKESLLTVRMLDREMIESVLTTKESWSVINNQVTSLSKENGFDGVVLNLEVGMLAFGSYTKNITPFVESMSNEVKKNGLSFSMTFYGDNYYRGRPYDVKKLQAVIDEALIMTYDFSKSFGNPGPNFPFSGRDEYGYDFQKMVEDFKRDIPTEKITIIFGMYGYRWEVDKQGRAIKQAESLSVNQIRARYIDSCSLVECSFQRDTVSAEMKGTLADEAGYTHIIWFEDEVSVKKKSDFLKKNGIGNISFWAHGYD